MALVLKANRVVEGSPQTASLEDGQIVIGRLPSNQLVIPGESVEPIHALVEVDEESGEIRLLDMASDEGILLNGKKVEVIETLKKGDVITIAGVEIRLDEETEEDVRQATLVDESVTPIDIAGGMEEGEAYPRRSLSSSQLKGRRTAAEPGQTQRSSSQSSRRESLSEKESKGRGGASSSSARPSSHSRPTKTSSERSSGSRKATRENLFAPGKERPTGSTLEVVAFWENSILDVKHYGGNVKPGEEARPTDVTLGNEENDQLIGVGPKANTRNYRLAKVDGGRAKIFLNKEMKAKVRRTHTVEKVVGPNNFTLSSREMALIKHGPLHYYLKNVSLPNPVLRRFQDADGKPIIFVYAMILYFLLAGGIWTLPPPENEDLYDEEIWAQVLTIRTPTPKPEKPNLPAPKPVVQIEKPKPPAPSTPAPQKKVVEKKKETPQAKPAPVPVTAPKVASLQATPPQKSAPEPDNASGGSKGRVKDSKDKGLGRKTASKSQGDSGAAKAGTKGAFASARKGKSAQDQQGVEGGNPNVMSGLNLAQLGQGIGKVSDLGGIGAVATGLKSQAGGAGAGSGASAKSRGFGGLGAGSSLNAGGVGQALKGLGGQGGGAGAGGLGDPSGRGGAAGRRIQAQAVVVPQGDPAIEGSLTREEIEAVIRQNLAQIKACYERNLQGNRSLAGRIKTSFEIRPNGRVRSATIVSSDLNNSATESCITGVIRRWKFPLPRGGGMVSVSYPFVFSPR